MRVDQHAPSSDASFDHEDVSAESYSSIASNKYARGARWAIVVSRFNAKITEALFKGAVDTLLSAGASTHDIAAVTVPGAVELSLAARELAETSRYAGIVVLGCVIRGETSHFDYVCKFTTDGVMRVQHDFNIPVGFGLVTCDTVQQAEARAQISPGHNVGSDAAAAAIEMVTLARSIKSS